MQPPASSVELNLQRELAQARIQIINLPGGGIEFILPATRNFGEKMVTTILLALFAACFAGIICFATSFMRELPWTWARLLAMNIFFYPVTVMGLVSMVFVIVCADTWLRSSRALAAAGELQIVTCWLFVKHIDVIPAAKIIRTRAANNTTTSDTKYYDIEVVTTGEKPGWFFKLFPPTNVKDEIERQRIRTGGKDIRAMTNIQGQAEAEWVLSQLREALNLTY